ncbi:transglutaminase family protein [Flavobacterium cellulosilyticum]|uniref:Transglutaminase family protein n=1 Tax=Flavobacterium cellulosilyticum TaxID=2541731 RepID=A0A4R5CHN3_9FLAO|nr:transglutaminase family protein [Flavobacterium cellulosilyticum]TDD97823.1 transglutaminase family protein [Flavobacterium cellulosilyticum]
MKYKLKHKTQYTYANEVHNYQSILCLQPLNSSKQICKNFKLVIEPKPSKIYSRTDYFGNIQHYFSLHESHKSLKVTVTSEIEVLINNVQLFNTITCEEARQRFQTDHALKVQVLLYQLPSQFISWDDEIVAFAETCLIPSKPLFEGILDLIQKIFTEFKFKSGSTNVNTPLKTVLKERKGVCQDFSHLAIASLRSVGIPARYVSGYIETLPPKGKVKLEGSDASHAWISVYIPEMGWCEFDPTNNMIPQQRHIITAYGRDFADVSPMKGIIFSSGDHKVKVEVDVIPLV